MSLTNQLLNPPKVTGTLSANGRSFSNQGSLHKRYLVTLEDFVALGAFTSGKIQLVDLPESSIITFVSVKPTVAVLGVGTCTGQVVARTSGHTYGTSFNLKTAVSNTHVDIDDEMQLEGAGGPVDFIPAVDTTCGAITAGEVEIIVDYDVI